MPLLVQCPRGCEVRMSRNRAGRIVRCPSCKCAMRVPELTEAQKKMGGVIPCRAKIARRRRIDPEEQARQEEEIIKRADKQLEALDPSDEVAVQDTTPVVVPKLVLPVELGQSEQSNSAEQESVELADSVEQSKAAEQNKKSKQTEATEVSPAGVVDAEEVVGEASKPQVAEAKSAEAKSAELQASEPIGEPVDEASQLEIPKPVYKKSRAKKNTELKSDERSLEDSKPVSSKPQSSRSESTESDFSSSKPSLNPETERETVLADLVISDPELEPATRPELPLPAGLVARKAAAVEERIEFGRNIPRPPAIPQIDLSGAAPAIQQDRDWEGRLGKANSDRRLLARFFALCLCFVAIVNMVPAVYHWYHWAQQAESAALPRWIYIQVFIGALHLIYALFLAQIPDWSAMRAVSFALLFMAFLFGVVSTGLLVGGTGDLSGFLGIPFALNREACIWCVAMLSLATLMAYWVGKEAANWQRAEHLLKDIIAKPAA